ncbi:MAG: hypothetical protein AAF170_05405 [Bacteroidota bacterium]
MKAHRADTTVSGDGSVVVHGVPFPEGEEVEVIVLPRRSTERSSDPAPLRGSVRRYDDPFVPTTDTTDWDAA